MLKALAALPAAVVLLAGCSTQFNLPADDADAIGAFAWCADVGGDVGSTNCGFVTLEQCRAAVLGIGGICYPNPGRGVAKEDTPSQAEGRKR